MITMAAISSKVGRMNSFSWIHHESTLTVLGAKGTHPEPMQPLRDGKVMRGDKK